MDSGQFPIDAYEGEISKKIAQFKRLVISAPPGSGKSTRVPRMLLSAVENERLIVVLEPRRIAARSLAQFIARELGETPGQRVGYVTRFSDKQSNKTRVLFMTEGVLLRMLQKDPELTKVDTVIFDEFHERNVFSDVALALVKALQESKRPDLSIVVMSATLDVLGLANYLGGVRPEEIVVNGEGTMFPVSVHYDRHSSREPLVEKVVSAVREILSTSKEGDLLVFLPGKAEIQRAILNLGQARLGGNLEFLPLHGSLPEKEQDQVFGSSERRRIIVATNVAETSITVEGVRFVIDSGLARVARYDSEKGIDSLMIEEISRASAEQRAGRAGRLGPGDCYRLWSESNHLNREERLAPEIARCDLAETGLLLASMGVADPSKLDWLDAPESGDWAKAHHLLTSLGALNSDGWHLTQLGRAMARIPAHPRFARILLAARRLRCEREAALAVALSQGRDILLPLRADQRSEKENRKAFGEQPLSDYLVRLRAFEVASQSRFQIAECRRFGIHAEACREAALAWRQLMDQMGPEREGEEDASIDELSWEQRLARAICSGFVDQLCRRTSSGNLDAIMAGQRSGMMAKETVVQESEYFVASRVLEIGGMRMRGKPLLSWNTAVDLDWVKAEFPHLISATDECEYDSRHKRVEAFRIHRLLDLELDRERCSDPDPLATGRCLVQAWREGKIELKGFNYTVQQWIARVRFIEAHVDELGLRKLDAEGVDAILVDAFKSVTLAKEAQAVDLVKVFRSAFDQAERELIEELAPVRIPLEHGRIEIVYLEKRGKRILDPPEPEGRVKLHEMAYESDHPRLCDGQVPLFLRLIDPKSGHIADTEDWSHFKKTRYASLKSALSRKFSSTVWPPG